MAFVYRCIPCRSVREGKKSSEPRDILLNLALYQISGACAMQEIMVPPKCFSVDASSASRTVFIVSDACAGISDNDHQRALDAMALYGPLIEITSVDAVLGSLR